MRGSFHLELERSDPTLEFSAERTLLRFDVADARLDVPKPPLDALEPLAHLSPQCSDFTAHVGPQGPDFTAHLGPQRTDFKRKGIEQFENFLLRFVGQ